MTNPSRPTIASLEHTVLVALEDIKAKDIELIDTSSQSSLFDRIVVASADSNRQTRALARHVCEQAGKIGAAIIGVEGEKNGEWVLVDLGDLVVHIMQPAIRIHYNLEDLWQAKPSRAATPSSS